MSVCDASLIADALLVAGPAGDAAVRRLADQPAWAAPHLLPVEVASVARRLVRAGALSNGVAAAGLERLERMRLTLHDFAPHRERVWELRENATPYDAWYLALAERLDEPLVTTDPKLAGIPGIRCTVEVLQPA